VARGIFEHHSTLVSSYLEDAAHQGLAAKVMRRDTLAMKLSERSAKMEPAENASSPSKSEEERSTLKINLTRLAQC